MLKTEPNRLGRKRYLSLLSLLPALCSLAPSQVVTLTGWTVFWWGGPILIFIACPLADLIVGDEGRTSSDEDIEKLSQDRFFRWCTYLYLPLNISGLIVAGYLWAQPALTLADKIGLAVTVGLMGGIGINTAHELGHRSERLEQWLSKIALAQPCYGHFFAEHSRGHHVYVATPADPVSARFGESYWRFLVRSSLGGLLFGIRAERERLDRCGRRFFSIHNDILQAWALSALLYGVMIAVFGWHIAPYVALQALVGVALLEAINYMEHYGLLRELLPNGRYERPSPRHAWNSNRLASNFGLFHLQRHSDHHTNPGRRYQTLRSHDEAPELPAGYPALLPIVLVPPLWRWIMDDRVLALYDGDPLRTNLTPKLRARLTRVSPAALSRRYPPERIQRGRTRHARRC